MQIRFEQAIPYPLIEQDTSRSTVWKHSVSFEKGEFVKMQAASGKGKSTFMQMIYGNRKDYEGKVFINDQLVSSFSHHKWAELRQRNLSIVFQDLRLFAEFTGWENIFLKLRLTDFYTEKEVNEMTERLGVSHLMKKPAGFMSYGERQRVAIIRSLMQPFDWILLDEPFSHLDSGNILQAGNLIMEECRKRDAGMLVACLDDDQNLEYTRTVLL